MIYTDAEPVCLRDPAQCGSGGSARDKVYYHIIPVSETSRFAQQLNSDKDNKREFWENLETRVYVSPIIRSEYHFEETGFRRILNILANLDANRVVFKSGHDKCEDIVTKHLVVDRDGFMTLCNRHLLIQRAKPLKSTKTYAHYNTEHFQLLMLRQLFPKIDGPRGSMPTSIPLWAIKLHEALKSKKTIRAQSKRRNAATLRRQS